MSATQSPGNVAGILLDGVVTALVDRPGLTYEQKDTRTRDVWTLVSSFQPRDPVQIMLIGQSLLFNELVADAGHDVLRGITETTKLRAQSNVATLNRALHQNLGTFLRLRDKSIADSMPRDAASEAGKQRPDADKKAAPAKVAAAQDGLPRELPPAMGAPMPAAAETPVEAAASGVTEAAIPLRRNNGAEPRQGAAPAGPAVEPSAMRANQAAVPEPAAAR